MDRAFLYLIFQEALTSLGILDDAGSPEPFFKFLPIVLESS
jgi:hypothetical protein